MKISILSGSGYLLPFFQQQRGSTVATAKKKPATKKVKTEEKSHLSAAATAAKAKLEAATAEFNKIIAGERAEVIKNIKNLIKTYGLEAKQLFPKAAVSADESAGAKYFDPKTGNSWNGGRGKAKEPFESIRHDEKALAKYLVEKKA